MKRVALVVLVAACVSPAYGQTFSSGSTGADGPLTLDAFASRVVQIPESGILNYTTINIPGTATLSFRSNMRNSPAVLLAQGDVVLAGNVRLTSNCSDPCIPAPGGFCGGAAKQAGMGPGGGQPLGGHGRWLGPISLVPLIGGSGGAGTEYQDGGPGGGALLVASSTSITVSGFIYADGQNCASRGSGGAIRLVANSITVTGSLFARDGNLQPGGNAGVIRIEAPTGALDMRGNSVPPAVVGFVNPVLVPTADTPSLAIASVGGQPVAGYSGGRPTLVDLLLPAQIADPISIVVQAHNIPVGTIVKMNVSGSPGATHTEGSLAGSLASSSATLTVSNLDRTLSAQLFVYATFDVPAGAAAFNPPGPDHVSGIDASAAPGGPTRYRFVRSDGSEIDPGRLPASFLAHFGR